MTALTPEARSVAVAAVLVSLGRDRALRLLGRFDADEIEKLGDSAARLGHVEQPRLDALTRMFERDYATGAGVLNGGRSFGSILDATRGPEQVETPEAKPEDPWGDIRNMPSDKLVTFLAAEHPNVSAMVVRKLGAESGGAVVQAMDGDARVTCLRAMVDIRPTPLAEQVALECLTARVHDNVEDGDAAMERDMATMLSLLDAESAATVMAGLAESLTENALARIAAMVLRFEDLARLTDTDRAALTAQLPLPRLTAALYGAPDALSEAFLSTMGQRARKMAESELSVIKVTENARDVARNEALTLARRMADDGAITLPAAAAD